MFYRLRQILPRHAWLLCVVLALTVAVSHVARWLMVTAPNGTMNATAFAVFFIALYIGASRVVRLHPALKPAYMTWLANSPWVSPQPLPLGPVHLVWEDLIYLVPLAALAALDGPIYALVAPIGFAAGYLPALLLNTLFLKQWPAYAMAMLLPLAWYPEPTNGAIVGVALALYVLGNLSLRRFLHGFPWNTTYWESDPVADLRTSSVAILSWPYAQLRPMEIRAKSLTRILATCLLLTWWFHVIASGLFDPDVTAALSETARRDQEQLLETILTSRWMIFTGALAAGRLLSYVSVGKPPISFLGRLATGRLIIPRYDWILLPPTAILLTGVGANLGLQRAGLTPLLAFTAALFLMLMLIGLSPSRRRLWLTGALQLRKGVVKGGTEDPQSEARAQQAASKRYVTIKS